MTCFKSVICTLHAHVDLSIALRYRTILIWLQFLRRIWSLIWLLLLFELIISTSGIELHRFSRVVGRTYAELVYEVFARI